VAVTQRTHATLKIFDQIAAQTAIDVFHLYAAIHIVAISGRDVHIAIIVPQINAWDIQKILAIWTAQSTIQAPQKDNQTSQIIM